MVHQAHWCTCCDNDIIFKLLCFTDCYGFSPILGYHWLETNVKMRLMGLAAPAEVKPLSEHRAVDLGAEILGESVVFFVGAATLYFEYKRSQRKEEKKEEEQNSRISQLQRELQDLELTVETQSTQLRELTRLVHSNDTDNRSTLSEKAKKEGKNIKS